METPTIEPGGFLSGVADVASFGASAMGGDTLDRLFHMSYTPGANKTRRGIENTLSGIASTAGTLLSATTPLGAMNLIKQQIMSSSQDTSSGALQAGVMATSAVIDEIRAMRQTIQSTNFTRIVDQNNFTVSQNQNNAMESWRAN